MSCFDIDPPWEDEEEMKKDKNNKNTNIVKQTKEPTDPPSITDEKNKDDKDNKAKNHRILL